MEPEPVARLVADRVRRLRRERGWSTERLAKACEEAGYRMLTRSTIAKIESGVRRTVTATEIAGLAKALGIMPTQLLAPKLLGQPDVALSMWPALRAWFGRQATRLGAEESDIEDLGFGKKPLFISHNRVDRPFVRRISRELRKRGVPYWLDEAEILPGDSLIEKIAAGITEMDYVLCFISEDSIKSSWVKKEISIALSREIEGRQVRVVPAMIGNVQARDLRRDIPYPLWDRLANVDTLRQLLRRYGKDV
jgi:transcriptional regulator with XRE-family HTH domain